jgi:beta-galactosidase
MFIWTGFDYRGEPTPYGWPSVTSYFGMMDLCGFPKDNVYYLRSWWGQQPVLHLLPHWNWSGKEGQPINVWAYSNCEEVELFLNRKSLGRKKMEPLGHLEWEVPYAPGTLEAIGYKGGKKILTDVVKTAGEPAAIHLSAHKNALAADGEDIAMITVAALDKAGVPVPMASNEITFSLQGPGTIIGVGNGDPTSLEKERYVETIETVSIENLREKPVSSLDDVSETGVDVNDAAWKEAFKTRDYKNLAAAYLTRGAFILPQDFAAANLTLFYKPIGREQRIFINGKEVAARLKEGDAKQGIVLEKGMLKPGKNVVAILSTPIPKKYEWENVNTDPGLVQLFTPAALWKRKLFNGLAQVIVQTTKEAGEITLTASAPGLKLAVLKIKSDKVELRPAVE